jgi:hypothetical protein
MAVRNSEKMTGTTIVATLANGRKEKQHDCGDKVGHPISAHDEAGACHVDGCSCPGYADKNATASVDDVADSDPRDDPTSKPKK